VLNSKKAVKMSIHIINVFIRLRKAIFFSAKIEQKLFKLGNRVDQHDLAIQALLEAIREMVIFEEKPKRKIGFLANQED